MDTRHTRILARGMILALLLGVPVATPAMAQESSAAQPAAEGEVKPERVRNIKEWDVKTGKPAIDGYDPVAYFPEGGGKPKKGDKQHEYTYKGVLYRFASSAHRDLFKKAPDRYEPQYGGWCAWAMAQGTKTEINPKSFIVKGDKLFLFYDGFFGDTKKDWEKGSHDSLTTKADGEWQGIAGEEPHSAPKPE
jgi:YHS domain-containing protein